MLQVALPEQTAERLQQIAARQGIDATELLLRLIEEYLAEQTTTHRVDFNSTPSTPEQKIEWEQQQYEAQHSTLLPRFRGQYIAMHEGKIIDSDMDRVALSRRIRNRYGKTAVLIKLVSDEPQLTITIRSPARQRIKS